MAQIENLNKITLWVMEKIEIKLSEYYDNPKYYGYMPEGVFNALESSFLDGKETAEVLKSEFESMLNDFNNAKS